MGYLIRSLFMSIWVFGGRTYIDRSYSYQFELGPHLYRHFLCQFEFFEAAPILIGYIPISLCLVWVGAAPISISHFSCQFEFSGLHLYWSAICLSVWVGIAPISIDHFSCQFEFSRSHLYWSAIFLSVCVQFELRSHLYRSTIFLLVCVQLESGLHLYQSVTTSFVFSLSWGRNYIDRSPHLMCLVWVGVAPISINHFPCQFEFFRTAPISISDFRDSLSFQGHTRINQPFSYHFHVSLSFSGPHFYRSAIFLSFPY